MRKYVCSLALMFLMAGFVAGTEVLVLGYDKDTKTVKVKDGDNVKSYKLTDKTKVTVTDKEGKDSDGKVEDLERRLGFAGGKGGGGKGGGLKLDITTDGDNIATVKMKARGGKNN
ncbi:MAG TPA: hypothetical protein VH092_00490 [Urbifossiella sp.]|nr:hypothetical protein [Urbifossiella sp.]